MDNASLAKNEYAVYEESLRPEMLRYLPPEAESFLDVGCSVGNFGELIKSKRPAEVWGIEPDQNAAEIARKKIDRVFVAEFESDLDLEGKKFDCIVFNDSLEHMVDPFSALDFAKQLLTPTGCIVASIPNVRHFGNIWALLVYKDWEYGDIGILDRTHLRFFTEKSIGKTFRALGYSVETLEGINPLKEYFPYLTLRFRLLNFLALGHISDMNWLQFAVVARPNSTY